jgi:hypothetical protein
MKLDDESILSAYLDDELVPIVREELASRLAADTALREGLAALTAARDAVAGLSRPALPVSLTSTVLARIEAAESVRSRRPIYWLATAASIACVFALTIRSWLHSPAKAGSTPEVSAIAQGDPAPDRPAPEARPTVTVAPTPASEVATTAAISPDEVEAGRKGVLDIFDKPGLRRIVVATDVIDPSAGHRIHALLKETARKQADFGRITIPQGIVIDPDYPNGAEVFVVVMDEPERRDLFKKIVHEFETGDHPRTRLLEETESEPRLGSLLTQIGDIAVDKGSSAAGLVDHTPGRGSVALKTDGPDRSNIVIEPRPDGPLLPPNEGDGNLADAGHASKGAGRPAVAKAGVRDPSRAVPVLVWLTSSQPARLDD